DDVVWNDDLDLDLGQQRDVVLLAAINGGVPFLAAMSPYFRDRHARHAELLERFSHFVDSIRADDCLDQLHMRFLRWVHRMFSVANACRTPSTLASQTALVI